VLLSVDQTTSGNSIFAGPISRVIPPLFTTDGPAKNSAIDHGFIGPVYLIDPEIFLPSE
jgi:hypothetical protein